MCALDRAYRAFTSARVMGGPSGIGLGAKATDNPTHVGVSQRRRRSLLPTGGTGMSVNGSRSFDYQSETSSPWPPERSRRESLRTATPNAAPMRLRGKRRGCGRVRRQRCQPWITTASITPGATRGCVRTRARVGIRKLSLASK